MRRLVAMPWIGEFGWELMSWQAYLRQLATDYDEVIISAPEGHGVLYEDFSDVYLGHSIRGVAYCWAVDVSQKKSIEQAKLVLGKYSGDHVHPTGPIPLSKQKFIKFGRSVNVPLQERYDVLVHARGRVGKCPEHSWEPHSCDQVVQQLCKHGFRVAAIGTHSYLPEGAVDRRGVELSKLMNLMSACRVVAGPSSGPMHLASLCGAKHVVWSDAHFWSAIKGTNRQRYERIWNPLNTPCKVLDTFGWKPPVAELVNAIEEALSTWKTPS